MQNDRIVVLFALQREAKYFYKHCRKLQRIKAPLRGFSCLHQTRKIDVIEAGMGSKAIELTLDWLFAQSKSHPKLIISAGFCGALQPDLVAGALVEVSEVINEAGETYSMNHQIGYRLLTASRIIGTVQEKQNFSKTFQASAVDMESAVIAKRCLQMNVDLACVKAVSDDYRTEISPRILKTFPGGKVSYFQLFWNLMVSPSLVFELNRLAHNTHLAGKHLAEGVIKIISSY